MIDIIYLHGFNSGASPNSSKVQELKKLEENVHVFQYDSLAPRSEILTHLKELCKPFLDPIFIGTSLGGYYASELAREFCAPSILINPALDPAQLIKTTEGVVVKNYVSGTINTVPVGLSKSYLKAPLVNDADSYDYIPLVLLDRGDELFESEQTEWALSGFDCIMYEGGSHQFEHMSEALSEIGSYINHTSYVTDLN